MTSLGKILAFASALMLISTVAARAAEVDPLELILGANLGFPSGFEVGAADCGDLLSAAGRNAHEAVLAGDLRFKQGTAADKLRSLHAIADYWRRAVHREADFLNQKVFAHQLDVFIAWARLFAREPVDGLRPLATELLVLAAKLEPIGSKFAPSLPVAYASVLRTLFERIVSLSIPDDSYARALRANVLAQLAWLKVIHLRSDPGADSASERRLALEAAVDILRESVEEDEAGLPTARFTTYAATLLPYLVLDRLHTDGDPSGVEADLVEVTEILQHGVRALISVNGRWERLMLDGVFTQLKLMSETNRAITEQIPGLLEKLRRSQDLIVRSRT